MKAIPISEAIKETPDARAERLEEARIADLEYLEECKEDRTDYQQGMIDAGMCEADFL
ncbi:MAG: hypothetical protein KAR06_03660 [Deltaproteobacteria bacterium]|nr:hypothetical protein [Deltaproteobacteria bacterium]